jgi:hypothetical protein
MEWYNQVSRIVLTRGVEFLLVTLPEAGKIYDSSLSDEFIDWKALPSLFGKNPKKSLLIRNLFLASFREEGTLIVEDPNIVFFTRCLLYLYKKVQIDCPTENVRKAVDGFINNEEILPEPSGSWSSDAWYPGAFAFAGDDRLNGTHPRSGKLWKIVDDVFATITPGSEVSNLDLVPKHGPGAVADMQSGKDKYLFPYWPSKLEGTFPWCAFAQHREDLHVTDESTLGLDPSEPPARLIAVPKTYKGPRLIASEPIAHQFLQQGLMNWFRENLDPILRNSIDFTSQQPSRDAALAASWDGVNATVDLSSASDRLSCWTVERAFGSNQSLLNALHAVRTRCVVDATGTDPLMSIKLKKFAAQGSAVTFPVQTIIYAGLCYAAVAFVDNKDLGRGRRRKLASISRKVRVFGDDIILPERAVPILSVLLESLKLKVNVEKTHTTGSFRESCGMDAWRGNDVTPLYVSSWQIDTSPEKFSSWVDVSNNAHKKGLWQLAEWMDSQIPYKIRKLTIRSNAEGDGIRLFTYCDIDITDARVRYNKYLHRYEAKVLCSRNKVHKKGRGSWNDLFQFFVEKPSQETEWSSGYITRNCSRLVKQWVPVSSN